MARLGDPVAPFLFTKGDRVAWVRFDRSIDFDFGGEVVDGVCEYIPGGPVYTAVYRVRRDDGTYFEADQRNLVRLARGKPRDLDVA